MRAGVTTTFSGVLVAVACAIGGLTVRAQDKAGQQGAPSPQPATPPAQPGSASSVVDDMIKAGGDAVKDLKKQTRDARRAIEEQMAQDAIDGTLRNIDQNSQIDQLKKMRDDAATTPEERDSIQKLIDLSTKTGQTPNEIIDRLKKDAGNEKSGGSAPPSGPTTAAAPGASGGDKTPTAKEVAEEIRKNIKIRDANDEGIRQAIKDSPDPEPSPSAEPSPAAPAIPPASRWTDEGLNRDKENARAGIEEIDKKLADLEALRDKGHRGDNDVREAIEKAQKDREDWQRRIREDDEALDQNRINREALQGGATTPVDPTVNPSLLQDYDPEKNEAGGDEELGEASQSDQEAADAAANAAQTAQDTLDDGGSAISGQGSHAGSDGSDIDDAFEAGVEQGSSDGRVAAQLHDPDNKKDSGCDNNGDSKPEHDPEHPPDGDNVPPIPPPETPEPSPPPEPAPQTPAPPTGHFPGDADGCQ